MSRKTNPKPATEASGANDAPPAWQPLTPGGIAAFARASLGRLLVVELMVALLAGGASAWFMDQAWFPVIGQAIERLPEQGDIHAGRLEWSNAAPAVLSANHYLSLVVDPEHTGRLGQTSDLQIEFGRAELRLSGVLGVVDVGYPRWGTMSFNQRELKPWWGAWSQAVLTVVIVIVMVWLLAVWAVLALLYAPVVRLTAFMVNRPVTWGAGWRLASAALMPGALLLTGAVVLYGSNLIDLVRLGFVTAFHVVVGWVYVVLSPLCLPSMEGARKGRTNPFKPDSPNGKTSRKSSNPFGG